MKKKLVGILVMMLLIVTTISVTGATNIHTSVHVFENKDLEPYQSTPTKSPDIINIRIYAKVTEVDDPHNLLEGKILVNDSITGKYNYDTATPDSDPDPNLGLYVYNTSKVGINLKADGFVFKNNASFFDYRIGIANDVPYFGDIYALTSRINLPLSNGMIVDDIQWLLIDTTGNATSSVALPITAPILSDWEYNILSIDGYSPSDPTQNYEILANVTSATLSRSKTRDIIHFTTQPILIWMLERFPNLFPILRQLLG